MKAATMNHLLCKLADDGSDEVQVKLKDFSPQPLGPGKVERVDGVEGAFRIITEVISVIQGAIGKQQQNMLLPVLFTADDVLWISERPIPKPKAETSSLLTGS